MQEIPEERFHPKTAKGKEKWLGVWDDETPGKNGFVFKTLGAKRYLTFSTGNGLKMTVSGVSKTQGAKWLRKEFGLKKSFEMFDDDLIVPPEGTGKLTHLYIDDPTTALVTDYTGQTIRCAEQSSVHLSPCAYSLGVADQYVNFVKYVQAQNTARKIEKEYPDK